MSISTAAWQLLALRFTMGFFGGHIVAVLALVSSACPPARLGWALGWLSTSQLAGMLLGPLIGGSIADALDSYRAPFVAGGCASLIVAFVVLRLPKQLPPESTTGTSQPTSAQVLKIYPDLLMIIVVLLLAQFAITSAGPIVSLYVQRLTGPVENLATLAGVAFSVIGLSGLIAAPQIGRAGDLIGRRPLLIAVLLAAAVFTLAQAVASTYSVFVAERFVAGLFLGGVIPLSNSLAAQCVTAAHRGRAFGLIGSATFLGAFIGPLGGGVIDAHFGPSQVFATASAALALAAIAAYRLKISAR
jgi:DHA1 family multidrug resistance protein-like MFS transporter